MPPAKEYTSLEFERILEQLAGYAGSGLTRELIRNIDIVFHPARIDENLDQTAEAIDFLAAHPSVQLPAFSWVEDLTGLTARIAAGELVDSQQARLLMQFLSVCMEFDALLKVLEKGRYPRMVDTAASWQSLQELNSACHRVFNENGEVRDEASPALARIRQQLRKFHTEIRQSARDLLQSISTETGEDAQLSVRGNRFVVLLPRTMAGKLKGSVVDISGSGHSVYFEPAAMTGLNTDRQHLFLEEDQEVRQVLRQFGQQIAQQRELINANLAILLRIDYIFARARYAGALQGGRPVMTRKGGFVLNGAVHPLLHRNFKPEDLAFDSEKALIVSGVNAGGKTVLLKLLGVYSLMASLGCFLPGEVQLPYVSGVHADIGDDQSTVSNLSTFTAHLQFVTVLWQALEGADSPLPALVLIDEIGTGTEPGEGAAFAYGLITAMLKYNVKLAVTTHYNVLKTLAFERYDVKNVSLEFDSDALRPTFRVLDNQPGQSFALRIAENWGLDSRILEQAHAALGTEEQKMSGVIEELERLRREAAGSARAARMHAAELDQARQANEQLSEELREAKRKFGKQTEALKAEVERRMEDLLSDTKRKLRNKARESSRKKDEFVKAASKTSAVTRRQKAELEELVDAAVEQVVLPVEVDEVTDEAVAVGDRAVVEGSAVKGTVAELDERRNTAVLLVHGKRLNVKLDKLARLKAVAQPPSRDIATRYRESLGVEERFSESMKAGELSGYDTLDLHGFTVEEAQELLDRHVSHCLELNLPRITIMHGVGTGRLRTFVNDYLSRSPHVASFGKAAASEGGVGVTIAVFK